MSNRYTNKRIPKELKEETHKKNQLTKKSYVEKVFNEKQAKPGIKAEKEWAMNRQAQLIEKGSFETATPSLQQAAAKPRSQAKFDQGVFKSLIDPDSLQYSMEEIE